MKGFFAQTVRHRVARKGASKPTRDYRALLFQGYLVSAIIAFAGLMLLARRKPYFDADVQICRAMQRLNARWCHWLMHLISLPGYPPQVNVSAPVLAFALYRIGLKWEAVVELCNAMGIGIVGLLIKIFVNRPRPQPGLVNVLNPALDGGRFSFPAGHVQTYVSIIGFLAFISFTVIQRSWPRTLALISSLALIVLIGPARIHAGEHWPSDVLGGYFFGSSWLWLTIQVYRWGKPRFFANQPLAPGKLRLNKNQ